MQVAIIQKFKRVLISFSLNQWSSLTNSIELNVAVSQVLWIYNDFILGFSVSDQDAYFAGVWTQPHVGFEVVLKDEVQSHSCTTVRKKFQLCVQITKHCMLLFCCLTPLKLTWPIRKLTAGSCDTEYVHYQGQESRTGSIDPTYSLLLHTRHS